ncbi:hypothetical protein P1X15_30075 [Runella sp. MFBS21]|uniref:hypothetical protein n=1 Tax=Runella sp. MFBS21 TaxID=3034018 RepID=UPI0023F89646|nr:hypothetical protein [Runella sp. MFBS21]MDF7821902.1 hypothetical protein [Runella sp. MFBS21]
MPHYLSHTNRQGSTAYIRAVATPKGGTRYYITKDPKAADLLEEMPISTSAILPILIWLPKAGKSNLSRRNLKDFPLSLFR